MGIDLSTQSICHPGLDRIGNSDGFNSSPHIMYANDMSAVQNSSSHRRHRSMQPRFDRRIVEQTSDERFSRSSNQHREFAEVPREFGQPGE